MNAYYLIGSPTILISITRHHHVLQSKAITIATHRANLFTRTHGTHLWGSIERYPYESFSFLLFLLFYTYFTMFLHSYLLSQPSISFLQFILFYFILFYFLWRVSPSGKQQSCILQASKTGNRPCTYLKPPGEMLYAQTKTNTCVGLSYYHLINHKKFHKT